MSFEIFTFIDCRQFDQVEATLCCWCDVKIQLLSYSPALLAKNSHWSHCLQEKWKYNVMATHSWWWMCACLHVSVLCVVCKCVCNGTFTPWSAWLANVIDGASTICQTWLLKIMTMHTRMFVWCVMSNICSQMISVWWSFYPCSLASSCSLKATLTIFRVRKI